MNCRFCKKKLKNIFVDLGFAPPSNSYLEKKELSKFEIFYPLRVFVCNKCFFVQTEDFTKPNVHFNNNYSYLSSTSKTLLNHSKEF